MASATTIKGIGTDLVEVDRFRDSLRRTPTLRDRLFTPGELAYADRAVDPTERLAVRFAAKEAVMKSMGVGLGQVNMVDIEVVRSDDGAPSVQLHGTARELASEQGIATWHISLTHTESMAHAMVIAQT